MDWLRDTGGNQRKPRESSSPPDATSGLVVSEPVIQFLLGMSAIVHDMRKRQD